MDNILRQTTEMAMYLTGGYVRPGDIVIDATCGNGNDTLRLAQMGPGRLFAFDIQPQAVSAARELLSRKGWSEELRAGRYQVICRGHEEMESFFQELYRKEQDTPGADPLPSADAFARAIVFNLGYLPGGDKSLTTKTESTLEAVCSALHLLAEGGLLCVTMYSGHPEGAAEKAALLEMAEALDPKRWHTGYLSFPNQKKSPPEILLITRK
jgi:SAM-dependent methyltransferase